MTQKTLHIDGMMCAHCQKHVTDALNALPGVTATVDHTAGTARVTDTADTDEATFRTAVEDAGYTLTAVES